MSEAYNRSSRMIAMRNLHVLTLLLLSPSLSMAGDFGHFEPTGSVALSFCGSDTVAQTCNDDELSKCLLGAVDEFEGCEQNSFEAAWLAHDELCE